MWERSDALEVVLVIGFDNFLHEPVPNDIFRIKMAKANAVYVLKNLSSLNKPLTLAFWKVYLRGITCDDRSRTETNACEKHFHL